MRYYQNQRLLLAIAALLNTLCSEAGEIAPLQTPAVKTKAATTKPSAMLQEVAVTATRSEADVKDIPADISTLDRSTLDRRLPRDEADLFRDEPDVVVARDLRRFGSTRVNIRGLEDVRVVQMVDGVRLPDFYNGGGPTNFTMSGPQLIMPDFIKRMEILRGSASSLYGSDAIGGVVGYRSLNPEDLLKGDDAVAVGYRSGYFGANDGISNTGLVAFREGIAEGLIGLSGVHSNEADNQGKNNSKSDSRTAPNNQDGWDSGLLAKLIIRPFDGHKITAQLEARDQNTKTDVLRLASSLPRVTSMQGDDNSRRVRTSLEWEHKAPTRIYDRLQARFYYQDSNTENSNTQQRTNTSSSCSAVTSGTNSCFIDQDFLFSQISTGGGLQLEKAFDFGSHTHLLTYGTDIRNDKTEQLRDMNLFLNNAATPSKSLAGDVFPLRDFANGSTDTLGFFFQDEISGLFRNRLTVTPGLRYDWRRLSPEVDALAQQVLTANGKQAVQQTDNAVSPKLAALWHFTPEVAGWGQVMRGFRAPNYNEVNGSFRNTAQQYGISPNPSLKPETSVGFELGLRYSSDNLRSQVSVFDNYYRNFIENVRLNCPSDPSCIGSLASTFMSVNQSKVNIRGVDARGAWDFIPGWRVDGAAAYIYGNNNAINQPINSIDPTRFSLGLAHDAGKWGAETRLRAALRKTEVNDTDGVWFRPPSYVTTDITAWWQPHKSTRITAGINNLLDKKYWLWSDIRQADATNPVGVDFYSQPGRNVSVALNVDW
ncbi:TonB-dependent hemoglobin/transferrin/lactoferrin family receptor [Methylobacter sp.]|uniref:TonB-dependent hemoglobin/transferrin/lactoferrin family receptor n=1 Tax=Methylobacter sp. TaxID=2051955 RepID=UPI002FDE4B26